MRSTICVRLLLCKIQIIFAFKLAHDLNVYVVWEINLLTTNFDCFIASINENKILVLKKKKIHNECHRII